jgi:cytochrome oxidase Cu insertion factor (SCO1/SenC/PrrC family)
VWKDYGVFQSQHGGGGVEHYDVDHSSRIYVIDAQGNWRMTYPAEMDWEAIASDVQHMMKKQG